MILTPKSFILLDRKLMMGLRFFFPFRAEQEIREVVPGLTCLKIITIIRKVDHLKLKIRKLRGLQPGGDKEKIFLYEH